MTIYCPHCSTGYLLPDHLMSGRGVRVRCPGCQSMFVVMREDSAGEGSGTLAIRESTPGAVSQRDRGAHSRAGRSVIDTSRAPEPDLAPPAEPAMVAGAVFDVLAGILGDALIRSRARGTVLSDHGPAILAVWEEYRRRVGADAPPAVFRSALKDRCGVDLTPRHGA